MRSCTCASTTSQSMVDNEIFHVPASHMFIRYTIHVVYVCMRIMFRVWMRSALARGLPSHASWKLCLMCLLVVYVCLCLSCLSVLFCFEPPSWKLSPMTPTGKARTHRLQTMALRTRSTVLCCFIFSPNPQRTHEAATNPLRSSYGEEIRGDGPRQHLVPELAKDKEHYAI